MACHKGKQHGVSAVAERKWVERGMDPAHASQVATLVSSAMSVTMSMEQVDPDVAAYIDNRVDHLIRTYLDDGSKAQSHAKKIIKDSRSTRPATSDGQVVLTAAPLQLMHALDTIDKIDREYAARIRETKNPNAPPREFPDAYYLAPTYTQAVKELLEYVRSSDDPQDALEKVQRQWEADHNELETSWRNEMSRSADPEMIQRTQAQASSEMKTSSLRLAALYDMQQCLDDETDPTMPGSFAPPKTLFDVACQDGRLQPLPGTISVWQCEAGFIARVGDSFYVSGGTKGKLFDPHETDKALAYLDPERFAELPFERATRLGQIADRSLLGKIFAYRGPCPRYWGRLDRPRPTITFRIDRDDETDVTLWVGDEHVGSFPSLNDALDHVQSKDK